MGRFKDPLQAERALAEGHCDLVGVVRGQIADADFAAKARAGATDAIRSCLSCNQECVGRMGLEPLARVHREPEDRPGVRRRRAAADGGAVARRRTVMVVGAGPAGLQAAIAAARNGHEVTVYEKESQAGGQVRLAASVPNRAELGDLVRNQLAECRRLGVTIEYGVGVWPGLVAERRPDTVVVATGAEPARPWWAPPEAEHVVDVRDVLDGSLAGGGPAEGDAVVVVDELGFHQATSVAELLADRGCQVEVVTNGMVVGQDLGITLDMEGWWMRATAKGIVQSTDLVPMGIDGRTLHLLHHPTGADAATWLRTGWCWPSPPRRSSGCTRTSRRPACGSSGWATASRRAGPTPRSSKASAWGRRCDRRPTVIALVPVRDGVLPAGAEEVVAECGGRAVLVGTGAARAATGLAGLSTEVQVWETEGYRPAAWSAALAPVMTREPVVVLPASADGRDLAPRLAHRLGRPLLAGAIEVTPDRVVIARWGGLAVEDVVAAAGSSSPPCSPACGASRVPARASRRWSTSTSAATADEHAPRGVEAVDAIVLEVLPPDPATMDLAEATRIVAGGAGLDVAGSASSSWPRVGGSPRRVARRHPRRHRSRAGSATNARSARPASSSTPGCTWPSGSAAPCSTPAGSGQPDHIVSVNTDPSLPDDAAGRPGRRQRRQRRAGRAGGPAGRGRRRRCEGSQCLTST